MYIYIHIYIHEKGKLDEIPGIGPANIHHFNTVQEETRYVHVNIY
jgi:hypothetical protein